MTCRSTRVALLVAGLLGLALLPSSLLGLHGVESALALGIVLPVLTAMVAARRVAARLRQGARTTVWQHHAELSRLVLLIWGLPVLMLALNALRFRHCTPFEGLLFMLLGPLLGCWVAGVAGMTTSLVLGRTPTAATLVSVAWPLLGIALGLHRFWDSPIIFALGHFYGYFPGTIYDEGVSIPLRYLSFRASSLTLGGGLLCVLSACLDPALARLRLARARTRPGLLAAGMVLLGATALSELNGEALGHRSSAEFIAEELGASKAGQRCTVHAPREIDRQALARLVDDCDLRVRQAERTLGVTEPDQVHAFLFRSAEEKGHYMGASRTYIAKPWRNEVYLQLRGWPHPVLAHEIAHVVAGEAASGPFQVGGQLGGFLPDPALIEGTAVAMAWNDHDELTPHQLAKALVEIDRMPTVEELFGLSFLAQPPRNAYTAAGSFIRFLLDHHGQQAVRALYRGGDVAAATGQSLDHLNAEWRRFLSGVELDDAGLELARVRFSRGSLFSTACPHALARLRMDLGQDMAAADDATATGTCERILEIDPGDVGTRTAYVGVLARSGMDAEALDELAVLRDGAPAPFVASAEEAIADAAWRDGDATGAREIYEGLLATPQSIDRARAIEVKLAGLSAGGAESALVFDLLVGRDGRPAPTAVAVHVARELRTLREDGLGAYLEARQLMNAERFRLARPLLAEASARGLPTDRLRQEARRLLGVAQYATGQLELARRTFEDIRADHSTSLAGRGVATDWLERIGP